jgi:hypothetical protein
LWYKGNEKKGVIDETENTPKGGWIWQEMKNWEKSF